MCGVAFHDCLVALKAIPDWFLSSKMIKNLLAALYPDDDIFYFNEDSGDGIFSCNEMSILRTGLNNINLDNTIIMKLLFMLDFWLGMVILKNGKHLKKS